MRPTVPDGCILVTAEYTFFRLPQVFLHPHIFPNDILKLRAKKVIVISCTRLSRVVPGQLDGACRGASRRSTISRSPSPWATGWPPTSGVLEVGIQHAVRHPGCADHAVCYAAVAARGVSGCRRPCRLRGRLCGSGLAWLVGFQDADGHAGYAAGYVAAAWRGSWGFRTQTAMWWGWVEGFSTQSAIQGMLATRQAMWQRLGAARGVSGRRRPCRLRSRPCGVAWMRCFRTQYTRRRGSGGGSWRLGHGSLGSPWATLGTSRQAFPVMVPLPLALGSWLAIGALQVVDGGRREVGGADRGREAAGGELEPGLLHRGP